MSDVCPGRPCLPIWFRAEEGKIWILVGMEETLRNAVCGLLKMKGWFAVILG